MKRFWTASAWFIMVALPIAVIAGSAIDYTQNTGPALTDEMLGIDAPAGAWAINRFPLTDIFSLLAAQSDPLSQYALTAGDTYTGTHDFGGATVEVPNSTSLPGSCTAGQIYVDTDADSGEQLYVCEAGSWVLQSGGGAGISDLDDLPGDDTDNDLIDYDLFQQVCKNPLSSAPATPYNGQIECADGDNWQPGSTDQGTDDWMVIYNSAGAEWLGLYNATDGAFLMLENVRFCVACSDESTDLAAGTAVRTFRMPHAMTLTAVRASINTASTDSGSDLLTVDINDGGTTVLSTKLTFDETEKTTTTAATAAVISDTALADDAEITIDIDQVGDTAAGKGLKVCFFGTTP